MFGVNMKRNKFAIFFFSFKSLKWLCLPIVNYSYKINQIILLIRFNLFIFDLFSLDSKWERR